MGGQARLWRDLRARYQMKFGGACGQAPKGFQQRRTTFSVEIAPNEQNAERPASLPWPWYPSLEIYPRWYHLKLVQTNTVVLHQRVPCPI